MKKINSLKEFYDQIEKESKTIVYFYTNWCPDCFAIKMHLPRLEKEFDQLEFVSMDRDIDIDLARHLNIFGIPSFLVFENGDELGRFVDKNRKTYEQVKAFIEETIS